MNRVLGKGIGQKFRGIINSEKRQQQQDEQEQQEHQVQFTLRCRYPCGYRRKMVPTMLQDLAAKKTKYDEEAVKRKRKQEETRARAKRNRDKKAAAEAVAAAERARAAVEEAAEKTAAEEAKEEEDEAARKEARDGPSSLIVVSALAFALAPASLACLEKRFDAIVCACQERQGDKNM